MLEEKLERYDETIKKMGRTTQTFKTLEEEGVIDHIRSLIKGAAQITTLKRKQSLIYVTCLAVTLINKFVFI